MMCIKAVRKDLSSSLTSDEPGKTLNIWWRTFWRSLPLVIIGVGAFLKLCIFVAVGLSAMSNTVARLAESISGQFHLQGRTRMTVGPASWP